MNIHMMYNNSYLGKASPINGEVCVNGKKFKVGRQSANNQQKQTQTADGGAHQMAGKINESMQQRQSEKMQALNQLQEMIRQEKEQKPYRDILAKVENGEDLSQKELEYLREKNPQLYEQVKTEIMVEKQFEERLKHCKDKDEAMEAYVSTAAACGKMCGIKGGCGVKPNPEKYKRLMKRINKVWQRYLKGELGKKKDKVDGADEKINESEMVSTNIQQQIESFKSTAANGETSETFSESI